MKYSVYAILLTLFLAASVLLANTIISKAPAGNPVTTEESIEQQTEMPATAKGKNLFLSNCQSCHALDKDLAGPALRGVENRGPWNDRKNLIKWVRNPAATISKFAYTENLLRKYGFLMPSFPQLSDEEIESIFDHIKKTPTSVPVPIASR